MRRTALAAAALLLSASLLGLSACGLLGGGREKEDEGLFGEPEQTGPAIPYEVAFEGDLTDELRTALQNASAARREAERPPASRFLLERRAEADVANLVAALHSLGYYDGSVEYVIRGAGQGAPPQPPSGSSGGAEQQAPGKPAEIVYKVEPRERYRFAELNVALEGEAGGFKPPGIAELGLVRGAPASAEQVLAAQSKLVDAAGKAGHPFAEAGDLDAVIDRDSKTMDVTLTLKPGPVATFAEPAFSGAGGVKTRYLKRRVPFGSGDRYDPVVLERARQALVDTNLFSTVRKRGDSLDEAGRLPVTFDVTQRKQRSIGAGLGFQTDEGPNASAFWEHRNLLGAGERLRLDLYASPIRQEATTVFRKPDVLRRDQNLLADASIRRQDTDAYQSESIGAGLGLERRFTPQLTASLGLAYRFAKIKEEDEEKDELFGLLSLPARLDWDYSDNLLDPSKGGRVFLTAAPFTDTLGFDVNFFKTQVTATRYLALFGDPRIVLALRGSLGSIAGAELDDIPADERFYSGGGGSVRGFGYQLAGPVDEDDNPIGGRSLFEGNAELRYRVTETIGVVGFLDTGTVFDAVVPDFSEDVFYGTGLGLRYITPIGPLRLDVGVPLNPRSGVDDPYQVYVSIGQAF